LKKTFYSHGKLLLTAEYVVLDGALALAIPTKFGQYLEVKSNNSSIINWKSYTYKGDVWFSEAFNIGNNSITCDGNNAIARHIIKILEAAKTLNPEFLTKHKGFDITTTLEFPQNWGLGSSSTLLNNVSNWANVDAFKLSNLTFGGSGYDIACAQNSTPIIYSFKNELPTIEPISFNPNFKEQLYFIHLNEKQNSRDGIKHYRAQQFDLDDTVSSINSITEKLYATSNFEVFCNLLHLHETLIGTITKQEPVKNRVFPDFNGSIKSLGAWGGDFVLVASNENPIDYFKTKGFETILSWDEMILTK
jgi:mevalonate kinase